MLAYCDYIADVIRKGLVGDTATAGSYIRDVGPVKMDLHPTEGYFLSTKKVLTVTDSSGRIYKVTVEEMDDE